MEEHLLHILETNSRIIVPEFGAFIVKQNNPLTLVFNEFLQYNDGLLIDSISKREGIDRSNAKIKIEEFVKKVNAELNKGNKIDLGKLGNLVKTSSGKITLEELIVNSESTIATESTIENKEMGSDIVFEDAPSLIDEKISKAEDAIIEKPKVAEKAKKVKAVPVITHQEKPIIKEDSREQDKYDMPAFTTKGKRSRRNLLIWISIIVVINGLIISYFLLSDKLGGYFIQKNIENPNLLLADSIKSAILSDTLPGNDSTYALDINQEKTILGNEQKTSFAKVNETETGIRYYVVAGVFKNELNADALVRELVAKGYNAKKFGKIGAAIAVSYNDFATKAEADLALKKINSETDAEAWIRRN